MKKLLFLYNPYSGTQKINSVMPEIVDYYIENGYITTFCHAKKAIDLDESIKEYDHVVVAGGDGTLNMMVNYLRNTGYVNTIGYIPLGSTNDFAGSLGISSDIKEALKQTLGGEIFTTDLGRFDESYFNYVAAFGVFTNVTYETPQKAKNYLGYAAYVLECAKNLNEIKSYKLKFTINTAREGEEEDIKVYEGDFLLGLITNSLVVGGMKHFLPQTAKLNDGLFEVVLVKKMESLSDFNSTIVALANGNVLDSDAIIYATGSRIEVESDIEVDWNLDGEFGGTKKNVIISNVKEAFSYRL